MIELIGWIGGILLSICALPQVVMTFRKKSTDGLSLGMLFLWGVGEIFMVAYIVITNIQVGSFQLPLLLNGVLNIIFMALLLWGKIKYDKKDLSS
jgi:uncharacterized protein with PQ loop repeat